MAALVDAVQASEPSAAAASSLTMDAVLSDVLELLDADADENEDGDEDSDAGSEAGSASGYGHAQADGVSYSLSRKDVVLWLTKHGRYCWRM